MNSKEVLTFQLGNYPNYVGAHWWNIQESYFTYDGRNPSLINHDVLFREGKTLKGEVTFTPRVIFVDKPENLVNVSILNDNNLKAKKGAADISVDNLQQLQVPEKHEFIKDLEKIEKGQKVNITKKSYRFDETVTSWRDYLKTRYHSKSVCTFPNVFPTEIFHSGSDIYNSIEEDLVEKIRSYMEECDNLQGFQVLVDPTDAYGGLANSVLLHLQDEYERKIILTMPTIPGGFLQSTPLNDLQRTMNIMFSYQKLTENSSLLVPIGTNTSAWRALGPAIDFPNLFYDSQNPYHTSAILASFLDTITLKYRMKEEQTVMQDVITGLNYYNKKVCAATMSLPFPLPSKAYLLDFLESLEDSQPLWNQITPGCDVTEDAISYQRITVRGISAERLINRSSTSSRSSNSRAYLCTSVEELVHLYLSFRCSTISDVTACKLPLKTEIPYPKIFSFNGSFDVSSTTTVNPEISSCSTITGLHSGKAVGRMLDSLHESVKKINIKKFPQFLGSHMDVNEFNECLEQLLSMGFGCASDVELR